MDLDALVAGRRRRRGEGPQVDPPPPPPVPTDLDLGDLISRRRRRHAAPTPEGLPLVHVPDASAAAPLPLPGLPSAPDMRRSDEVRRRAKVCKREVQYGLREPMQLKERMKKVPVPAKLQDDDVCHTAFPQKVSFNVF